MRDETWLKDQLEFLLKKYFASVKITNSLAIKFGREAKYRFGSIKLIRDKGYKGDRRARSRGIFNSKFSILNSPKKSIITITAMFRDEKIPLDVVHYTIAHELCHYAHGFSSANRRLFRYPHHGGVINQELKARGAEELIASFKKWLKGYRKKILASRVRY